MVQVQACSVEMELKSIEDRRRGEVEGECPVAAIEEDSTVEADPRMRIAEDC